MRDIIYDAIIVGSGPAGISCAIYLKRYNFNVLVIGKGKGSLSYNTLIDNYYGVKSIRGNDLIQIGIEQAKSLGVFVINEEVVDISIDNPYQVITDKGSYYGKKIFLGIGNNRKTKKYQNIEKFIGNGVSYCAICDGFFYRNKTIAIVGSGALKEHEKEILNRFSSDIIEINENELIGFDGDSQLEALILKDKIIKVDACFLAEGEANLSTFAVHLGLLVDENNNLVVNDHFMTNVEGIFAGGDAIGGIKQVYKAVYDGAQAAEWIKKSLQ